MAERKANPPKKRIKGSIFVACVFDFTGHNLHRVRGGGTACTVRPVESKGYHVLSVAHDAGMSVSDHMGFMGTVME